MKQCILPLRQNEWLRPKGGCNHSLLQIVQALAEILDDIVHVFETYRNTDQTWVYAGCQKLFICQLAVGGAGRVKNAGADISHMYLVGGEPQPIHKFDSRLFSAFNGDGNNATGALWQVFCAKAWYLSPGRAA